MLKTLQLSHYYWEQDFAKNCNPFHEMSKFWILYFFINIIKTRLCSKLSWVVIIYVTGFVPMFKRKQLHWVGSGANSFENSNLSQAIMVGIRNNGNFQIIVLKLLFPWWGERSGQPRTFQPRQPPACPRDCPSPPLQ